MGGEKSPGRRDDRSPEGDRRRSPRRDDRRRSRSPRAAGGEDWNPDAIFAEMARKKEMESEPSSGKKSGRDAKKPESDRRSSRNDDRDSRRQKDEPPAAPLTVGSPGVLQGLEKRPELNGRTGCLGVYDEELGRWEFIFDSGEGGIRVRPSNIRAVDETKGRSQKERDRERERQNDEREYQRGRDRERDDRRDDRRDDKGGDEALPPRRQPLPYNDWRQSKKISTPLAAEFDDDEPEEQEPEPPAGLKRKAEDDAPPPGCVGAAEQAGSSRGKERHPALPPGVPEPTPIPQAVEKKGKAQVKALKSMQAQMLAAYQSEPDPLAAAQPDPTDPSQVDAAYWERIQAQADAANAAALQTPESIAYQQAADATTVAQATGTSVEYAMMMNQRREAVVDQLTQQKPDSIVLRALNEMGPVWDETLFMLAWTAEDASHNCAMATEECKNPDGTIATAATSARRAEEYAQQAAWAVTTAESHETAITGLPDIWVPRMKQICNHAADIAVGYTKECSKILIDWKKLGPPKRKNALPDLSGLPGAPPVVAAVAPVAAPVAAASWDAASWKAPAAPAAGGAAAASWKEADWKESDWKEGDADNPFDSLWPLWDMMWNTMSTKWDDDSSWNESPAKKGGDDKWGSSSGQAAKGGGAKGGGAATADFAQWNPPGVVHAPPISQASMPKW